jgi:hypothetical protein
LSTSGWEQVSQLATREPTFGHRRALTEDALAQLGPLRAALDAYRRTCDTVYLDGAFAAARAFIAALPWVGGRTRPDLEELRWVTRAVPEFSELLSSAADEAERAISASLVQTWRTLGLRTVPPGWTGPEVESARMLFACTCAAGASPPTERVPAGLRGLTAVRAALQLTAELAADERLWERALGQHYDSVRHRYARRTTWRNRGLADLLRDNGGVQRAVSARLERWLTEGARLPALAGELEAALVHERTPVRFA